MLNTYSFKDIVKNLSLSFKAFYLQKKSEQKKRSGDTTD